MLGYLRDRFQERKSPLFKDSLLKLVNFLAYLRFRGKSTEEIFATIYHQNTWLSAESKSGIGSSLVYSESIRAALPHLLKEFNVRVFFDAPCGDLNWMREMDFGSIDYVGGDIVEELIKENERRYGSERKRFITIDIVEGRLPDADMMFCRDCLVHLSNKQVLKFFENLRRSRIRYLATTSFPEHAKNIDIQSGGWRPLNLERPPFNLPRPRKVISENLSYPLYRDKSIAVWARSG